jgi:hypothetical protein
MIKGKQIEDKTIKQPKLNLITPILASDCATKEYVDANASKEYDSKENRAMTANVTTVDGDLATDILVQEQPLAGTGIRVFVNGKTVPNGPDAGDWCYFSPDGNYIRPQGGVREGDALYWRGSVARMQLDTDDEIDLVFVTNTTTSRVIQLAGGDIINVDFDKNIFIFTFTGGAGETALVLIDGTSFIVGNVAGDFVFDIGNVNGYLTTFTTKGEFVTVTVNTNEYDILFDGFGSLKFSVYEVDSDIDGGSPDPASQNEDPIDGGSPDPASQNEDPIDGGSV